MLKICKKEIGSFVYGRDSRAQEIILNARTNIAHAKNGPRADTSLVITEYNTSTGGNFDRGRVDTEDLFYGVSMAQILHVYAVKNADWSEGAEMEWGVPC